MYVVFHVEFDGIVKNVDFQCYQQVEPGKRHNFAKMRQKKRHQNFPKSARIWGKSATNLTPQTIFIAFLCINFFRHEIFLKQNL